MSDDIKFNSTSRELLSLRKGNIYLGVGDSPKGPTSLTGFKSTLNLATASTIIALHRGDGAFSWYRNYSDEELISRTNRIDNSVQRTTKEECYSYFSGQSDKIILNRDYEKIITDNLVLNVDAGFLPSYPATGSIWYDTGSESHGTFENSPTYNTSGWLSFNGTNQLVNFGNILSFSSVNSFTIELWFLWDGTSLTPDSFYHLMGVGQNYYQLVIDRSAGDLCRVSFRVNNNDIFINTGAHDIYSNTWNHVVATYQPSVESKIYLNGVLKNTGSGVSTLQSSGNFFQLGGVNTDATFFPGSISIARVYTKVLSDTEVLNNFNNQQVRYNVTTTTSTTTSGVTTTTSTTTTSSFEVDKFVMKVDTSITGNSANNQFGLKFENSNIYCDIEWGDGSTQSQAGYIDTPLVHTYPSPGIYIIQIKAYYYWSLQYGGFFAPQYEDGYKILEIMQWGGTSSAITSYSWREAFSFCYNLDITASDRPNIPESADFRWMFYGCSSLVNLNGSLNTWVFQSVYGPITNAQSMFQNCSLLNTPLNNWDVCNFSDMSFMFDGATNFNQNISTWKVPNIASKPSGFDTGAGFENQSQLQPQWGVSCV